MLLAKLGGLLNRVFFQTFGDIGAARAGMQVYLNRETHTERERERERERETREGKENLRERDIR
jgi:hypothetical protein